MIREEVARRRREYETAGLDPEVMADDPFSEFEEWFAGVLEVDLYEPSAFVLATVDADGTPSARALLMKDLTAEGLVFYTGLDSRKSRAMTANPRAAATFVWTQLHRQVRLEGSVAQVTAEEADVYFTSRPRGAQIAAHASRQSEVVVNRSVLEERFEAVSQEYGETIPRPEQWGGWRLSPEMVEFWQGRPNRFHDRIRYRSEADRWVKERLSP
ncbi:MAG TPA: pyridoxamine 5'-phosphate oxidase [Acidimicrobiia bacterium]|nr:pyridoxamine 5'-phosphate oxidase [Acidimicrobiia bacterium]